MKEDLTIWTVYHKDGLLVEYPIQNPDTHKYYAAHGDDRGEGINKLNPAWSELVALYYLCRHQIVSEYVGINHYRRQFDPDPLPKHGECCCYAQYNLHDTILDHYGKCHKREDMQLVIDYLDEFYGQGNKYSEYLKTSRTLLGNICFVMRWREFTDMCEWLFGKLFTIQERMIGKSYYHQELLDRWRDKAVRDFSEDRADYQMRTISFFGERLVSAWIATNMRVIQIAKVNPQP